MLKRLILVILVFASVALHGCVSPSAGLVLYNDSKDGYHFLYPNGWQEVSTSTKSNGLDIVFHDIIEPSENVSVVIGKLQSVKDLHEIGNASDVGLRVLQRVIAPNISQQAELLSASEREVNGRTYYSLEYAVRRPNGELRHDLVSVTANRGNLYTLSVSAKADRWTRVKDLFHRVADSFVVE
jgi:photosystem II oxygen-evolving enhancer protein 2